jgi:hypothetical protein
MPRQENILSVFVASPSDVNAERARLEDVISELNVTWSRTLGIRLELVRWETHAVPGFGVDGQDVVNRSIPADFDVFIGIMWHRFGTPTKRAESGTHEEFLAAKARWDTDHSSVQLLMYFKDAPLAPSQVDAQQLAKVNSFRSTLGSQGGLYWTFESVDDFASLVKLHLTRLVQNYHGSLSPPSSSPPADGGGGAPLRSPSQEEDEIGLLELSERFEDALETINETAARIIRAVESIGKKADDHTKRIRDSAALGPISRPAAKRMIAKFASDLSEFASKLDRDNPRLREAMQDALGALSQSITMWPELIHDHSDLEQLSESITGIGRLRGVILTSKEKIESFLTSVTGLPRLTSELNRSKRKASVSLQALIDLFESQARVLEEAEASAKSIYGERLPQVDATET